MWPFKAVKSTPTERDDPKPVVLELRAEDDAMERARNIFRMMGMAIRADEIGELLLRRAVEGMKMYRDLDFKHASYIICDNAEGKGAAPAACIESGQSVADLTTDD